MKKYILIAIVLVFLFVPMVPFTVCFGAVSEQDVVNGNLPGCATTYHSPAVFLLSKIIGRN